jgi:hypothetical protein
VCRELIGNVPEDDLLIRARGCKSRSAPRQSRDRCAVAAQDNGGSAAGANAKSDIGGPEVDRALIAPHRKEPSNIAVGERQTGAVEAGE